MIFCIAITISPFSFYLFIFSSKSTSSVFPFTLKSHQIFPPKPDIPRFYYVFIHPHKHNPSLQPSSLPHIHPFTPIFPSLTPIALPSHPHLITHIIKPAPALNVLISCCPFFFTFSPVFAMLPSSSFIPCLYVSFSPFSLFHSFFLSPSCISLCYFHYLLFLCSLIILLDFFFS